MKKMEATIQSNKTDIITDAIERNCRRIYNYRRKWQRFRKKTKYWDRVEEQIRIIAKYNKVSIINTIVDDSIGRRSN